VPKRVFKSQYLGQFSLDEPYLFSAILTVAATDPAVPRHTFEKCYAHMKGLVLSLVNGIDAGIDAVESLLLLAEWMSHWSTSSGKVGRGEEDKVVWMYVGTAVRLAYFMDLDRVPMAHDTEQDDHFTIARKRLVWAGQYDTRVMCLLFRC
jgi:hypothetical protein